MPRNSKVEAKSTSPKKPIQKTDVSKIRALEEQLAQHKAELAVINGIQTALASKMDFQGIIDTVGDKLNEIFKDENIGIGLTDKARNVVHFPYAIENGKRLEPVEISLGISSLVQHITKRRRPLLINSKLQERFARNDAIMFPGREQRNPKSWLTVPFFKDGEVIGGMSLRNWEHENAYNESDVRLLQTIANSMIVALENARLLKETEQRATELQIIDNIGQILNKGVDLSSMVKHVAERLHEVLKVENIAIAIHDPNTGHLIVRENYYIAHPSFAADRFSLKNFKFLMRLSARGGGRSWVVNSNAEKSWRKYGGDLHEGDKTPKSFVALPLLAGGDAIGGIIFADYEKEHAFSDLPIRMLETIASNMGTAIQNVSLFDETQRLLKQTEQRATELQIINNIGQTLTEGLDLQSMLERVGERLREALQLKSLGIIANDTQTGLVISHYLYLKGKRVIPGRSSFSKNMFGMRFAARVGGSPLVVNTNVEKNWRKFIADVPEWAEIPKAFVIVPLLAGRELVGSITIADYENENAFIDLPINLLETIASNMGTAIQNVRLFDETQRLLKETEQRATELQIINNIGQTLTEGLDLNSALERVGERLRAVLQVENFGITAFDVQTGQAVSHYIYLNGNRVAPKNFSLSKYKLGMRFAAKMGGKPLVVNANAQRYWGKIGSIAPGDETPKSFAMLPMMAGKDLVGSITIVDFEKENAFPDLPLDMLETIASNMGTAIQNVRLFEETQRLLKETEQRATELQIINNIGQTLSEGLDLSTTLERVGDRLREALKIESIGIIANDIRTGLVISAFVYLKGKRVIPDRYSLSKNMLFMRFVERTGGKPVVINTNVEKNWRKFLADSPEWAEIPKAFVMVPLLAGGELVGSITIPDYEREDVFTDLPINMLETIASNMGTAIQNVRLFDETQRLLKETEQRATELQIINNIGQTLTEGGDLESMIQRVGERIREALSVKGIVISVFDEKTGHMLAPYMVHDGKRIELTDENFDTKRFKLAMRASARAGGRSWVVNKDAEKSWHKWWAYRVEDKAPKSFATLPLLTGREVIGGITIVDYENENAFTDLSVNLLETIASNMGTAVQNVRLFDETQRLLKEAEEARAAAERANKAKSTFLANMSHELRTPLNAIIGFTSIVRRKTEGVLPEKQAENLDKVLSSSQHLLGLINTALDIAKIEAGRMDIIPAKFSLSTLVDQCATLAVPLLKPNVTMEKQLDENIGLIFSDQDKVKQIVLNLLSNAAKFTHAGKIVLGVEKVDTPADSPVYLSPCVRVSVTDSGIGISKEALGRVFEEFQQADNTTTRQYGGTGLGLTISRNLARLLGGDLIATSELGKGSTFTLTLPIQYGKKTAASLDTKPDSAQSTETQSDNITPIKENGNKDSLKTILIVEDTELNISLLTQLLEGAYNLLVAKDGAQGVNMAQQENPDLILMDISLPIMDGYEATRRIRMTMPSTPIIGLSAHAMSGDDKKAKEAGCNEYLTKPVNEDLLLQKLNQYLR